MKSNPRGIADFFSALSDETRVKILIMLHNTRMSVNEIRDGLGEITLPAVTYQLKILLLHDIVRYKKEGRHKYFSLSDSHVLHILSDAITHMQGSPACNGRLNCEDGDFDLLHEVL